MTSNKKHTPAPELLEACEGAEKIFSKYGEMYGFTEIAPDMWGAIDELRAAIAEAKK